MAIPMQDIVSLPFHHVYSNRHTGNMGWTRPYMLDLMSLIWYPNWDFVILGLDPIL